MTQAKRILKEMNINGKIQNTNSKMNVRKQTIVRRKPLKKLNLFEIVAVFFYYRKSKNKQDKLKGQKI